MLTWLRRLLGRAPAPPTAPAWPPCDRWQDEIPGDDDLEDPCPACKAPRCVHARRCPPDEHGEVLDDFLLRTEGRDACDACGRTQAEHQPGARPCLAPMPGAGRRGPWPGT